MSFFTLSLVGLWVALSVLSYFVYLLLKHYGKEQVRLADRYRAGPLVGPRPPYQAERALSMIQGLSGQERAALLLFVTADCPECLGAREAINVVADAQPNAELIAVFGREDAYLDDYVDGFHPAILRVMDPKLDVAHAWFVPGAPYMIALDTGGYVRGKGKFDGIRGMEFLLGHATARSFDGTAVVASNPAFALEAFDGKRA